MSNAIRRSLPSAWGAVFAGILALLAASCFGGSSFNYNGQWEGHRKLSEPGVDPTAMYTIGWVTLSIHDLKFDLVDKGLPTSGSVLYRGDHVVLHTETLMNRPLEQASPDAASLHPDITVTPQKDGSLLFDDPLAIDRKALTLTRKKP